MNFDKSSGRPAVRVTAVSFDYPAGAPAITVALRKSDVLIDADRVEREIAGTAQSMVHVISVADLATTIAQRDLVTGAETGEMIELHSIVQAINALALAIVSGALKEPAA